MMSSETQLRDVMMSSVTRRHQWFFDTPRVPKGGLCWSSTRVCTGICPYDGQQCTTLIFCGSYAFSKSRPLCFHCKQRLDESKTVARGWSSKSAACNPTQSAMQTVTSRLAALELLSDKYDRV
eukprot:5644976-Prymnesium_polylepis.1